MNPIKHNRIILTKRRYLPLIGCALFYIYGVGGFLSWKRQDWCSGPVPVSGSSRLVGSMFILPIHAFSSNVCYGSVVSRRRRGCRRCGVGVGVGMRLNSSVGQEQESESESADWFTMPATSDGSVQRTMPCLPSEYFLSLATSQFELMANSLFFETKADGKIVSKVKQAALYLPQENAKSGQLEFLPTLLYPNPVDERIFIANQIGSGLPPYMPKVLTKLPGIQNAQSLIPQYPFVTREENQNSPNDASSGCGTVEEVLCDPTGQSGAALSVPIFHGSQTVGVVLVWPNPDPQSQRDLPVSSSDHSIDEDNCSFSVWTEDDKMQISRVAYSLAIALAMDRERTQREIEAQFTELQVEQLRLALSENLHQIKNPLQALRAFGKILQRKVMLEEELPSGDATPLRSLADNMIIQSERVIDLLLPMDSMLAAFEPDASRDFYLVGKDSEIKLLTQGTVSNDGLALNSLNEVSVVSNSTTNSPIMIRSKSQRQTKSSDRISPYAKSGNIGDFELEMTFLADYIQPILEAESVIALERGIDFEVDGAGNDELPGVLICPKSLRECITNLIDNAIKYVILSDNNSRNKYPRIRVTLMPNEESIDPGVTIFVEDNGPGIPINEHDLVFSRGFRGNVKDEIPDGDGIGLAICKSMISRMGGDINIVERGLRGLGGTSVKVVLYRSPKME